MSCNLKKFVTNLFLTKKSGHNISYSVARCCFATIKINKVEKSINSMVGKSLLTLQEFTPIQIEQLLWTAIDMKSILNEKNGKVPAIDLTQLLRGRTVAAIFQKRSTRTRFAFEGGAHALGAHAVFCNKEDIHLGVNESVQDTSLVLSRLSHSIGFLILLLLLLLLLLLFYFYYYYYSG